MIQRLLAGFLSGLLFTFGSALLIFFDRNMVIPLAMFTFPTIFLLGIPMSIGIDLLLKRFRKSGSKAVFLAESVLYLLAGYVANLILFWAIAKELILPTAMFQLMGVIAAYLYFLNLYALRKWKNRHDQH
ncbi:hypothetical protein [Brevibacillus fulvus]|uniref:Drug/metabolite transporter (DMT)-like permease n=1 Tax=Brevibacillus fulvus TaxID=1125967 RepID=A0A938XW53_9BACL|nr:hypothetical protein [Brevibacillus fulvus]MBM7591262.1 drug/metabolite transporter (DMT)-like permease [Brevibacillus fulvus]